MTPQELVAREEVAATVNDVLARREFAGDGGIGLVGDADVEPFILSLVVGFVELVGRREDNFVASIGPLPRLDRRVVLCEFLGLQVGQISR